MPTGAERTLLKRGTNRAVFLERDPTGAERVVKLFRSSGLVRRLGDRVRAEREARTLRELDRRGVRVPAVICVRAAPTGGWELVLGCVPGALRLDDAVEGAAASARSPGELARAVGRLLADAHTAGLRHPDLHPGNVLLDSAGRAWLIDVAKARVQASVSREEAEADLIELAAATRERVGAGTRLHALASWARARSQGAEVEAPDLRALAEHVEHRAVARRRAAVMDQLHCWTRPGRVVRSLATERGVVIADVGPELERELLALEPAGERRPHPTDPSLEFACIATGRPLRADWVELGRASYHQVPAMQPVLLVESPPQRAVFAVPCGSTAHAAGGEDDGRDAPALKLQAALADRGFEPVPAHACYRTPAGGWLLGVGARLVPAAS